MFDTTVLKARLQALSKAGVFKSRLVNTLTFPTKVTSKTAPEKAAAIQDALKSLFEDVKVAANVCAVDLETAGGTFIWSAKNGAVYQPSLGALGQDVAISWGRITVLLSTLAQQGRKFKIRELTAGKQYALDIFHEQESFSLDFWIAKGKIVDKAKLVQRLDNGKLYEVVDAVKVYTDPITNLAQYKGELHVSRLVTNTPGQYGINGTIWFHELPQFAFSANKKLVYAVLTGFDEYVGTFEFPPNELEFVIKGLVSKPINGQQTEWLDYTIVDKSLSVEDFYYDESTSSLGAGEDGEDVGEFDYEEVAEIPY